MRDSNYDFEKQLIPISDNEENWKSIVRIEEKKKVERRVDLIDRVWRLEVFLLAPICLTIEGLSAFWCYLCCWFGESHSEIKTHVRVFMCALFKALFVYVFQFFLFSHLWSRHTNKKNTIFWKHLIKLCTFLILSFFL